jgi:hypothetical protein
MNHLGDTNKMVSDTPRTHLQDRLLSMVHAFHDDQRKYAVRLLANDVADLEHKLNAAQKRIKRLEEAGDGLSMWVCPEYKSDPANIALQNWRKAKEDKL